MILRKTRPRLLGAVLATIVVVAGAAPARADLWTGSCALRVTIEFRAPVRPPLSGPNYDLYALPGADLDLTQGGAQSCVRTLSSQPVGSTSAEGSGTATAWSCGTTLARGSWTQAFDTEGPQEFSGTHVLTGTWGAWTLHIQSHDLHVIGVGELTLDPSDAAKTSSCATTALESVTLVGTIVFQDP
ncbi:MAG: hypothetical protein M3134_02155 [Actinomycetota bacterium]|nr:hypothetical protein [Actinomycetota bacterium]